MARPQVARGAGVVYTKAWLVDLILDLVGYDENADLALETIVEPGCGDGAFLRRIIPRLIRSAEARGHPLETLASAIRAYEIDPIVVVLAREAVVETLTSLAIPDDVARALARSWVVEGDFLLSPIGVQAQWVVGNPPYVRVEETSAEEYGRYRERWTTMSGRADVYIGFFEAGLSLLKKGGSLCFICADRWMHNQYGAGLRKHIIDEFALRALLEVHDSNVFDVPVAAYPAVTLIQRAPHTSTALATATSQFDVDGPTRFLDWWRSSERTDWTDKTFSASVLDGQFRSDSAWPSGPPERLRLIADLEAQWPSLPEVGISVGVGMATGADRVYVVTDPGQIEPRYVKRAIGPADIRDGAVAWAGRYLISPWDGLLPADLESAPGLSAYLNAHTAAVRARYVAKRNPDVWWRTIDRPPPHQYLLSKLVVADIHDRIEPVLDVDGYWPLHSTYYLTSVNWDLEALGGYLLSDVAGAFVEAYSVKMANGHLRVSAQYLKRIRLPHAGDLTAADTDSLRSAFLDRDRRAASRAVAAIVARLGTRPRDSMSHPRLRPI